jgi:hypothetical protein
MSKSSGETSRKLIDHVAGPPEFGPPRAILATTFELSRDFVDLDFLPALLRLKSFDDRRVRSRLVLEGELAKMRAAAILMDARCFHERPLSLRVDLRPATMRGGGVLHAKVTVVVHDDAVRLLVGSANLTSPGYRANREVAFALHADKKRPEEVALVRQALASMPDLLQHCWSEHAEAAHKAALEVLDRIDAAPAPADAGFVWGGEQEPLWQQVVRFWPEGEVVRRVVIVSPFWSEENGDGPIARLMGELRARGCLADRAELLLVAGAVGETNKTFRPALPASYQNFDFGALGVEARAVAAKPQVDAEDVDRDDVLTLRALHAKVLLLEGAKTSVAYGGSANFTVPGWGFGRREASNIEAGVVLRRRGRAAQAKLAQQLVPPPASEPVSLRDAAPGAIWVAEGETPAVAFPTFLRSIELRPRSGDATSLDLVARIDIPKTPAWWSAAVTPSGEPILHGDPVAEYQHVALAPDQLNAILRSRVVFIRRDGMPSDRPAIYPVNVALAVRENLPFGDPEAFPGENELVAFYQGRVAWEDVFPLPPGEEGTERSAGEAIGSVVDTSKILSYQVREFVEALQGVRQELRAAKDLGRASLRLALVGPVSPRALAKQVHTAVLRDGRSSTAGAFQLVELLACFTEARAFPDPREPDAWLEACDEALASVRALLDDVRARAATLQGGSLFDRYAKAVTATSPAEVSS